MNNIGNNVAVDCPYTAEALEWVCNPSLHNTDAYLSAHVAACPICQQEIAAWQKVVTTLQTLPQHEPSPHLTERIMAALPPEKTFHTFFINFHHPMIRTVLGAAAVLAIVAGIWFASNRKADSSSACTQACESTQWLIKTQSQDGSWDPAIAGGEQVYRPALTALATLALETGAAKNRQTVDRAVVSLLAMQQPDGAFGAPNSARAYNHGIVTCALLSIAAKRPAAMPEEPLRKALAFIRAQQNSSGGWGYGPDAPANTAITVWQLEALAQARNRGWGDPDGCLRRGLRWLRSQNDGKGHFAYSSDSHGSSSATLDAMGAYALLTAGQAHDELTAVAKAALKQLNSSNLQNEESVNIYRDYFAVRALESGGLAQAADKLRQQLSDRILSIGNFESWQKRDTWNAVGGRLYTTSFAMLTMR